MKHSTKADAGSVLVGEYVDEVEIPKDRTCHRGEVVRATRVHTVLDRGVSDADVKEFTVLLHGGRVVVVRGHGLKLLPAGAAGEPDTYGIVVRAADREELVALFRTSEVAGIFHGEVKESRTIA